MRSEVLVALAAAAVAIVAPASGQIPIHHHLVGTTPGQHFGTAVSGAGDVNADGYGDVIVGATDGNGVSSQIGIARVYSGFDGSLLHTFIAGAPGSAFGAAVAGAGDVDDDGYDDLVVGARYDSTNGTFAGAVYVYSGFDGSLIHDFYGSATADRLGVSVDGAGDVNGDGKDDIIAGAYFAGNNGFWSGSAYVYSGHNGSILRTWHGQGEFEFFGASVAGVGDVNGGGTTSS
jgi:FG-GAP repeat